MVKIDKDCIQIEGALKENLAEILLGLHAFLDIFGKETFYKMVEDTYNDKTRKETLDLMIKKMLEFKGDE